MGRRPNIDRKSSPPWLNPSILNGFGFVPRRGAGEYSTDNANLRSLDQILVLAKVNPLQVLCMLPDVMPEVGKAVWNGLRLGCGQNSVRLKAMKPSKNGMDVMEAPDGTEAIKELWRNLPAEVGSLEGALTQNFLMVMFSGMCAVEAVPGARNKGIAEVWPIDTLTLRFKRNVDTKHVDLWQRLRVWGYHKDLDAKAWGGYIPLPMDRVFWKSMDGFPDDPYGRAPMAPALNVVLDMIAFMKDLLLAWHRVGTPRWDVGFDYEMHARIAREQMGLTDKQQIEKYIEDEFNYTVELFNSLEADDTFFHDIKSEVKANGSGGAWPNIDQVYNILRWRMIMALKEMPTLMGVVEGNTETWSSVDWQIYAKGLEAEVAVAADPLVRASQLHLQLLGMPYIVEATYEPVRANQRMVDAQSEQLETQNEAYKRDQGWQTQDEASIAITGSAAVKEPDKDMLGLTPKPVAGAGGGAKNSEGKTPQGPSKAN